MTKRKRQTILWPRGKDRQYNDQEEKTDNTITKSKRQTIVFSSSLLYCLSFALGHCFVCLFLLVIVLSVFYSWLLYCLSFPLGYCIVCLFLFVIVLSVFSSWSLYCLSFTLCHCIVCLFLLVTDNTITKSKRQTIQ
jgi:hypothetical protein